MAVFQEQPFLWEPHLGPACYKARFVTGERLEETRVSLGSEQTGKEEEARCGHSHRVSGRRPTKSTWH